MEVVSLSIAIVPLLISAVEIYKRICSRPFSRYQGFSNEVRRYLILLDTQQTLFRSHCLALLQHVVDDDDAGSMLEFADHSLWSSYPVEEELARTLGTEIKKSCMNTFQCILDVLNDIEHERGSLTEAVNRESEPKALNKDTMKDWKRHIAQKLRFSFSETRLNQNLSTLRELNLDLRDLYTQLRVPRRSGKTSALHDSRSLMKEVKVHQTIREASRILYTVLSGACKKHIEHTVYLSVEIEHTSQEGDSPSQVKFSMAFASAMKPSEPVWIVVKSSMDCETLIEQAETGILSRQLIDSLKRPAPDSLILAPTGKKVKSVRFRGLEANVQRSAHVPDRVDALVSEDAIKGDFCDFLRRCCCHPHIVGSRIGVLESAHEWRNVVYPEAVTSKHNTSHQLTLKEVIARCSNKDALRMLSVYQRLSLVRRIATAFLRCYTTQWAQGGWESGNICFFDKAEDAQNMPIKLTTPHLNATICGPSVTPLAPCSEGEMVAGARNPYMFRLGILFLEIAYASDWETLKRRYPARPCNCGQYADFFTARRLAKLGTSGMAGAYIDAMERLIECDFGCGDDLAKPELQMAYQRDIINPLKEAEERLREMKLDV